MNTKPKGKQPKLRDTARNCVEWKGAETCIYKWTAKRVKTGLKIKRKIP